VDEPVHAEADGPVGRITLNRPQARNAVTVELGRALHDAVVDLATRTRVLVIRGAGGHFSAGGDFAEVSALRAEGPDALRPLFENFGAACAVIGEVGVPVVAAVEGYALAGGFELLQSCDVVVVREDAKIADNHLNFGQVPGGGSSQRLPRLVGRSRALAHILTGDRISGTDLHAWGLAHRVASAEGFDAAVAEVVDNLAGKDPAALARAKRLVRDGLERPLAEGLATERETVVEHLGGDSAAAGIAAFDSRTR
jgi:enoyl-CoA hydratase/carnithine racemase